MSDSYLVIPLDSEIREWLDGDGFTEQPVENGRSVTFQELKAALSSVAGINIDWSGSGEAPCALLSTAEGEHSSLVVSATSGENGHCKFHFRGGHIELIERIVGALSGIAGPQVVYAHSGSHTKIVYGS